MFKLLQLPSELLVGTESISSYLDVHSLLQFTTTCKYFTKDEMLQFNARVWIYHLYKTFGWTDLNFRKELNWRRIYVWTVHGAFNVRKLSIENDAIAYVQSSKLELLTTYERNVWEEILLIEILKMYPSSGLVLSIYAHTIFHSKCNFQAYERMDE